MSSKLNKATSKARKGLIIFLIFAISTFVVTFVTDFVTGPTPTPAPNKTNASAYLPPDQKLGLIPKPKLSSLPVPEGSISTFSLIDRTTLPELPPVANIYVINKPREKLGNTQTGRKVATNLGLPNLETTIADSTLFWQTPDTIRSLTYNKQLEKWIYQLDLQKEQITTEDAEKNKINTSAGFYNLKGISLLGSLGIQDNYFTQASSRVDYINIHKSTGKITTANTPRLAEFVRIAQYKSIEASTLRDDYEPKTDEAIKTVYTSTIRKLDYLDAPAVIITRGNTDRLVPQLTSFNYHKFNYGTRGVYKLLTSTEAYLKIQSGLGKLYWLKINNQDPFSTYEPLPVLEYKIDGAKTSIVYLEPEEWSEAEQWTNYLQPYYFFEGTAILRDGRDANFTLILPALSDSEYLQ